VHPALCHKDKKVQSAIRQARGVMVVKRTFYNVRNLEHLARLILPYLDNPEKLGSEDTRYDILVDALYLMRENRLIGLHRKSAKARITNKGLHIDSLIPRQRSNTGRRHGQRNLELSMS
jgi:hypothetical protein